LLIPFRSVHKHGHHRQFLFVIGLFLKISPLKPLGQMYRMSNRYRGPPIYAFYQVSVHLAKRCQRRRFLEIDQSEIRQFLFVIGLFLKISPLKPLGQMYRNLVGCIYGRSSINITHFVPIH
jgi:hypothetical protein